MLVILIITGYLYIKFNFYEVEIIDKIKYYNKTLENFTLKLEKLDSISLKKFDNYHFDYLEEINEIPIDFNNDYAAFISWIKGRTNKIKLLSNQIDLIVSENKNDDTLSFEYQELLREGKKSDSLRKVRNKNKYTSEEQNNINEEADKVVNDIYNQKK